MLAWMQDGGSGSLTALVDDALGQLSAGFA
jgi:hypothetical protein